MIKILLFFLARNKYMNERSGLIKYILITINFTILFLIFNHKSSNPLILDRYSLSFIIVIFVVLIGNIFFWMIWIKFKTNLPKILLINFAIILLVASCFEIYFHVYALFKPNYKVLWFYPNRDVGWTFPPNKEYEFDQCWF